MAQRYQLPLFYQGVPDPRIRIQGFAPSIPVHQNGLPVSGKRFFDLLPPELVAFVVQQVAATSVFEQRAYRTLRKTLYSLCLTSKHLRSLAQPLLLETLIILEDDDLGRFRTILDTKSPADVASIRNLGIAECFAEDAYDALRFDVLAKAATGLQELRCAFDLSKLTPFLGTTITSLSLSEIKISGIASFSFPQIKSLSIHECSIGKGKRGLEIEFHLPSLRHLAFIPVNRAFNPSATRFLNLTAPSLITATLSLKAARHYPPSILENPSITRSYLAYIEDSATPRKLDLTLVEHLQIEGCSFPELSDYKKWTKLIESASQLKSLTLPPTPRAFGPHADMVHVASQNIVDICLRRQIKVFHKQWSDQSDFSNFVDSRLVEMAEASVRLGSINAGDRSGQ
ncbi:hypothetical protein JCM3765_004946 [Sporobolomyces pararoseus]